MRGVSLLLIIGVISVLSCKQVTVNTRTETMEIFGAKGGVNDKEVDSLRYYESSTFIGDAKIATAYFDSKGEMNGEEKIEFDNGLPIAGKYYNKDGKLLSYYKYVHDNDGQVVAQFGFDASNDELLTIKTFTYDAGGRIVNRKVFEGDFTMYRQYDFSFDDKDNETSMVVKDNIGDTVLVETFKISAADSLGAWKEKWGFVNGNPLTFYKKTF
jgi:hypothetical protein